MVMIFHMASTACSFSVAFFIRQWTIMTIMQISPNLKSQATREASYLSSFARNGGSHCFFEFQRSKGIDHRQKHGSNGSGKPLYSFFDHGFTVLLVLTRVFAFSYGLFRLILLVK